MHRDQPGQRGGPDPADGMPPGTTELAADPAWCFPLDAADRNLGLLVIGGPGGHWPPREARELAAGLARRIAVALDKPVVMHRAGSARPTSPHPARSRPARSRPAGRPPARNRSASSLGPGRPSAGSPSASSLPARRPSASSLPARRPPARSPPASPSARSRPSSRLLAVSGPLALLGGAELWPEFLAAKRPLDELHGPRGSHQPAALASVGGQHCFQAGWRQFGAQLRARATVPVTCPRHAGGHMATGECGKRQRVPSQYAVQPVVGRRHVEQPGHRGLLELLTARWMDASGPAGRKIGGHDVRIAAIEQMF